MPVRIAINGFGRIGRSLLRALYESGLENDIKVVAINDPGASDILSHLFQYDSTHGKFNGEVVLKKHADEAELLVNGDAIKLFQIMEPKMLPWAWEKVDIVVECSGRFLSREAAAQHMTAGAKKVIISAPALGEVDRTVVYGVNHQNITTDDAVISMASCTTNCMAPILQEINKQFEIVSGLFTTIHSYSNNQRLVDGIHEDPRRARSATQSLIPTKSGAIIALEKVMPELGGRITGYSMRVPTLNVAAVDIVLQLKEQVNADAVNQSIKTSAKVKSRLIDYNQLPLVSKDFYHNPASAIFDATQTQVVNKLVKIVAWYDNEWGFANRILDVVKVLKAI